jgi:hypothetical protein
VQPRPALLKSSSLLSHTPEAVNRLGTDVFVKLPLFRTQKRYLPIYINRNLYREFFGEINSFEQMREVIIDHFSVTIDTEEPHGEQVGWAYADRQYDPLNIALKDNLGSGRAYYVGQCFNIKGEKTPLATSPDPYFSNGFLEMERGIWETMSANILGSDLETPVPQVLAILDLGEWCQVKWRKKLEKRVKIVRIDRGGSLDRITHVFFRKTPLSKERLHQTAQLFGKQEGEKFIERILHGAWSAGNISLDGRLMDFDTICAVKGRAPQFSANLWHYENFFGYEWEGQAKILEALCNDNTINKESVTYDNLFHGMVAAMETHIAKSLPSLMGFTHTEEIFDAQHEKIIALAKEFMALARKFYPKYNGFSAVSGLCNLIHVFDLSVFFRSYPLLKRAGKFSIERALNIMCASTLLHDPFVRSTPTSLPPEDQKYLEEKVFPYFAAHQITSEEQFEEMRQQAAKFIEQYDELFDKIMEAFKEELCEIETRAYIINEDRFYLFPVFTPSYILSKYEGEASHKRQQILIELFIKAGRRNPSRTSERIADIRVYKEGYYYILLDGKGGYRQCFSFFKPQFPTGLVHRKDWKFNVDGKRLKFSIFASDETIDFISENIDTAKLAATLDKEASLMFKNLLISHKDNAIMLTDFLDS